MTMANLVNLNSPAILAVKLSKSPRVAPTVAQVGYGTGFWRPGSREFRRMLRQNLHDITENGNPSSHQRLIRDLRKHHAHTITTLELDANGFNCIVHALDIIDHPEYV